MPASITLKEFLSRYTAIPERFINEYIEFYDLCKINKFGISVEKIMKYLGYVARIQRHFHKILQSLWALQKYLVPPLLIATKFSFEKRPEPRISQTQMSTLKGFSILKIIKSEYFYNIYLSTTSLTFPYYQGDPTIFN